MSDDIVGQWKLSLPDGRYTIEFEHGTTSGKRVIRVNNKVNRSVLNTLYNYRVYCCLVFFFSSFNLQLRQDNISD